MHTQALRDDLTQHLAADLDEGHSLSVEDRLADLDLTDEQIAGAVEIIEAEIERAAMHQTATVIRRIFIHLAGCNSQTAALAHALGFGEQTLDEMAQRFGVSKQNVGNLAAYVRPHLGPLVERRRGEWLLPPSPNGEVWLTVPQARKLTGAAAQLITRAIHDSKVHWVELRKRYFVEETSLLAWREADHLAAAQERLTPKPRVQHVCQTQRTPITPAPSRSSAPAQLQRLSA